MKIIYINKTDKKFAPDDEVFFKNLTIGQTRVELQALNTGGKSEPIEENLHVPTKEVVKKDKDIKNKQKVGLAGLSKSKRKGRVAL